MNEPASRTVSIVSATGMMGTGFLESSLREAVRRGAAAIGCDAGSSDSGPRSLGTGELSRSREALKRDLGLMIRMGHEAGIPVVIGSAINAGADAQLAEAESMAREIAEEGGITLSLAIVHSELTRDWLSEALKARRVRPLTGAPDLTEETVRATGRLVAQIGPEPIASALNAGADVVITGRASDAAVFAAIALRLGVPSGFAWHAGKILECGAAPAVQRLHPDSVLATFDEHGFTIELPNPEMTCSRLSVLAHGYYENANPYLIHEPGGAIDLSEIRLEELQGGKVRVSGSRFNPAEIYEVRVEGAEMVGNRAVVVAGISDPLLLDDLDGFLSRCTEEIWKKFRESLALEEGDCSLEIYRYGSPEAPVDAVATHKIGLVFEVIARDAQTARAAAAIASHTALHHPVSGWHGFVSNLAIPFSPAVFDGGPVYRWSINHLVELDDPERAFHRVGPFVVSGETADAP